MLIMLDKTINEDESIFSSKPFYAGVGLLVLGALVGSVFFYYSENRKSKKNSDDKGDDTPKGLDKINIGKNINKERRTLVVAMPIGQSAYNQSNNIEDDCFACKQFGINCDEAIKMISQDGEHPNDFLGG